MQITLNGKKLECEKGKTILDIAREQGIRIPTLCQQEDFHPEARCRICLVEVNGKLMTSCSTQVWDDMVINTDTDKVKKTRRMNIELMMADHLKACFVESREHELCKIVAEEGIETIRFDPVKKHTKDLTGRAVIRDPNKCISCGRCVQACRDTQAITAIDFAHRSHKAEVTPYFEKTLHGMYCIKCGQCILSCPVEAIVEQNHIDDVMKHLADPKKHIVVQTAPAVRASLGEEFGYEPGTLIKGKMVAAARAVGFNRVFDTNTGADLTIIEEANELLDRVKNNKPLPMFTSCCPAWVKYVEHFRQDLIPHLSSCKSPHEMLGALVKSYYAEKQGINPKDIVMVSIMPCTAKKFEASRKDLKGDVDYVLTTREFAKLIRMKNIDFDKLDDEAFDDPLGMSTGAGAIFGATGGVMEAALRTAYEKATGKTLEKVEFEEARGIEGIKKGSVMLDKLDVKFAVAHGIANAAHLLESYKDYHFIEVMACPGGCIGGGGQPIPTTWDIRKKRIAAIYQEDVNLPLRKSHENPTLKKVYEEFLGDVGGHKAHELLHTKYKERDL